MQLVQLTDPTTTTWVNEMSVNYSITQCDASGYRGDLGRTIDDGFPPATFEPREPDTHTKSRTRRRVS
jgi:hypothetical protein